MRANIARATALLAVVWLLAAGSAAAQSPAVNATEADYAREAYYRYLHNVMPDDPAIYDMILNTSRVTLEEGAAIVTAAFEAVRAARNR